MRVVSAALIAAMAATLPALPASAKRAHYQYNGHNYASYEQCRAARRHAEKRGTIIGAVGGGATVAVLGGNLGESALGAGVGALGGNLIGKGTSRKC